MYLYRECVHKYRELYLADFNIFGFCSHHQSIRCYWSICIYLDNKNIIHSGRLDETSSTRALLLIH